MKALIIGPAQTKAIAAVDVDSGQPLNLTLPRAPHVGPGSVVEIRRRAPSTHELPHCEDVVVDDLLVTGETITDLAGWIGGSLCGLRGEPGRGLRRVPDLGRQGDQLPRRRSTRSRPQRRVLAHLPTLDRQTVQLAGSDAAPLPLNTTQANGLQVHRRD